MQCAEHLLGVAGAAAAAGLPEAALTVVTENCAGQACLVMQWAWYAC